MKTVIADSVSRDWYHDSFGGLYSVVYAHRTSEAAEPEAAFAAAQLHVCPDTRLLDLCCGNGRHIGHLLRCTPHATGLDYSRELLAAARDALGPEAQLVRGDMRDLPFEGVFDVVTSFFTSFGYFMDDAENARVIQEVSRAMKAGGRFLIDHMNAAFVEKTLVPESTREYKEYRIDERRWLDAVKRRVNKVTRVWRNGKSLGEWGESVRLYEPDGLRGLLAQGRLIADRVFGSYDGAPLDADRPRMIVVGHKE